MKNKITGDLTVALWDEPTIQQIAIFKRLFSSVQIHTRVSIQFWPLQHLRIMFSWAFQNSRSTTTTSTTTDNIFTVNTERNLETLHCLCAHIYHHCGCCWFHWSKSRLCALWKTLSVFPSSDCLCRSQSNKVYAGSRARSPRFRGFCCFWIIQIE